MVVIILVAIIGCVVRRRHKDTAGPPETGEVCRNLMSGTGQCQGGGSEHVQYKSSVQPLPPPPTPTQWAHLYTSTPHYRAGSSQFLDGSGSCNTYEVPHHLGYTPGFGQHPPSLASSTSHGPQTDRGRHGVLYHKEVAAL